MNVTRMLILAMLLTQAAAEYAMTGRWLFPLFAAAASVAAFWRPVAFRPSRKQAIYTYLLIAVIFGLKWRLMPLDISGRYNPFPGDYALTHCIAQGFLVVQIMYLALYRFERAADVPVHVRYIPPLFGAIQLACVMSFTSNSAFMQWASLVCAGIFAILYALYTLQHAVVTTEKRRYAGMIFSSVLILFAVVSGGAAAWYLEDNASKVDIFFYKLIRPSMTSNAVGFSERATLDSVSDAQNNDSENVALRIRSETPPGYLRGGAFAVFDGKQWQKSGQEKVFMPNPPPPPLRPLDEKETAIPIRKPGEKPPCVLTLWPVINLRGPVFTTLDTTWVATPASGIFVNEYLCCRSQDMPRGLAYRILDTGEPPPLPLEADVREQYLQVPETLTPEARAVAAEALRGAATVPEKIQRAAEFFREHFTYKLGIQIPEGEDALSYFLTKRPAAHCEYFAAGAVFLLRLAGVPSRYVTGFVPSEKNIPGDYWVARNRDAHAWAEAWDPGRGWVTVEATPGGDAPHTTDDNGLAASWDAFRFRLSQWWALLREEGMAGLAKMLRELLVLLLETTPGRVLVGIAAFLALVRLFLRFRRKRSPRKRNEFEGFHRVLSRMDKQARKRGFVRAPHETLHQYAARIAGTLPEDAWNQHAAAWYCAYAEARFNGGELPELP